MASVSVQQQDMVPLYFVYVCTGNMTLHTVQDCNGVGAASALHDSSIN